MQELAAILGPQNRTQGRCDVHVLCACLLSSMAPCHQPAAGWPRWLAAGEPVLHCCRQRQEATAVHCSGMLHLG